MQLVAVAAWICGAVGVVAWIGALRLDKSSASPTQRTLGGNLTLVGFWGVGLAIALVFVHSQMEPAPGNPNPYYEPADDYG